MIEAIILIEAEPAKVAELAEQLIEVRGVGVAYSVTGEFDLVATVRANEHDELADIVTHGIAKLDGIKRTHTLVAFRSFRAADYDW
jgi:DNA-binding Lrp family transcriptional regulator